MKENSSGGAAGINKDKESKSKENKEGKDKEEDKKEEEPPSPPVPRKIQCCCGITYNTGSLVIGLIDLVFTVIFVVLVIHL